MSDLNTYPVLSPQAVSRVVDDVMVVLLPEVGEVKVLNEVGARIFQLVDGLSPVRQIAERIAAEFQVTPEQAGEDTLAFLQELQACHALTFKVAGENPAREG